MGSRSVRVDWRGATASARARRGADRGVESGAEHVRAVSVGRAPLRTGALRSSARVAQDPETGTAAVTFDAAYAVYQHEDLDYHHDVGGPKFLESALIGERGTVARLMQTEIRKALGT